MKIIIGIFLLTLLNTSFAYEKAYVKGQYDSYQGMKKLTFGLTERQMKKISSLTQGEVDFNNIFVTRNLHRKSLLKNAELHSNFYHPPFFVSEYDPDTKESFWQETLGVRKAWEMATGKGITLADCDAGFYIDEQDIAGNLLMEHARDFSDKDDPLTVNDGGYVSHGTAVAAMMVGILNGHGINGMIPDAKLIPLQNYNYSEVDDTDKEEATAACILHALSIPEVQIIVLENQTHGSSETFIGTREAVRLALKAGVTIVSAAGNSNNELKAEAMDDTGSIIVGAVSRQGPKESFSNWGSRVSVSAFGQGLLTLTGPGGKLGYFSGTSGATPQVASAVAMMLEVNPGLTPSQVKDILVATRITINENKKVGGMLNLVEAVNMAKSTVPLKSNEDAFRNEIISILKEGK